MLKYHSIKKNFHKKGFSKAKSYHRKNIEILFNRKINCRYIKLKQALIIFFSNYFEMQKEKKKEYKSVMYKRVNIR